MKVALAVVIVLFLTGTALAAPGDPRTLRGSLEWPATLSGEPFIVLRGDDGRLYYADVSSARRTSTGPIAGRVSLVGVEGAQPHEMAAVVIGPGDSALSFATPTLPTPAEASSAPSSLPQQAVIPAPPAAAPAARPPAAPPVPAPVAPEPAEREELWQIQGKVTAINPREFVIETGPGETVHVDVSKLSSWTRESVRAGDQVKLFGVPQKDRRLVANGFIQEVPSRSGSR